jgi:hypothetical protein
MAHGRSADAPLEATQAGGRLGRTDGGGAMTGRRAVGGGLAVGTLLGLVSLVPVAAQGATRATAGTRTPAAAPAAVRAGELPPDSGSLVLLLVAGGLGAMGLLSREPAPVRHAARR